MKMPLTELPPTLTLEKYERTGELVSMRVVDANDPVYQRLSLLLNEHHTGWQMSFVSYVNGTYVLRNENINNGGFIIDLHADMMIVNISSSGKSESLKKDIPGLLQLLGLPER